MGVGKVSDRVVLITGATSGVGLELSLQSAAAGARVVLHGRSAESAAAAAQRVLSKYPAAKIKTAVGDVATRAGVRSIAEQAKNFGAIDVLINNAGASFSKYVRTEDGVELSLAVNHYAPFLLTELLRSSLAAGAIVANVNSAAARFFPINADDPDVIGAGKVSDYNQLVAYGYSKLVNHLATQAQARRLGDKATVVLMDPGGVKTQLADKSGGADFIAVTKQHWDDCVTADAAAADIIATIQAGGLTPGELYHLRQPGTKPDAASNVTLSNEVDARTRAHLGM